MKKSIKLVTAVIMLVIGMMLIPVTYAATKSSITVNSNIDSILCFIQFILVFQEIVQVKWSPSGFDVVSYLVVGLQYLLLRIGQ